MGTSVENSLTNFDLDLLLGPASTSISENTEITDHGYQVQGMGSSGTTNHNGYKVQKMGNMETTDFAYQVQNMVPDTGTADYVFKARNIGNTGPTDHGYQLPNMGNMRTIDCGYDIQNMENKIFLPRDVVKKSVYDALKNDHDVTMKDYQLLKNQFAKLASDFSTLNVQNQNNAMAALNADTLNEQLKKNIAAYMTEISALQQQQERLETINLAHRSSVSQFTSLVNNLQTEVGNLKNDVKSEKINGKDGRKMISTLKKNNDTLAEHLCIFACVIEGRGQLDQEVRRLIKKYCKKRTPASNKIVEAESFESQSIDTGRGSSLAFSDGDRSFYSPAYSFINFSPMSTGTIITRNEQPKMKDASSSPPSMNKTFDISTSPITFEEAIIPPPLINVSTSPIYREATTPIGRTEMLDIATSPVEFADRKPPVAMTKMSNMATSPIKFEERRMPMTKTSDIATSPVEFADWNTPVAIKKTSNIGTSPIKFAEKRIPRTKTLDIATSPVEFADRKAPVSMTEMSDMATSPIEFAEREMVMTKTTDIATSPVQFAEWKTPVVKIKMSNMATSPIEFAERKMLMTKTSDIATSPVQFADWKPPEAVTKTSNIGTSPIKFAEKRIPRTKTLEIATSPVKFAARKAPVAMTEMSDIATSLKTLNIVTKPIEFTDTTPVPKTKTWDIVTSPIECAEVRIPANKTKMLDMTKPKECAEAKIPDIKTKTLDMTRPIDCAAVRIPGIKSKTLDMTRPIACAEVKIPAIKINTLDMIRPMECADVRNTMSATTKTLDIANTPKTEICINSVASNCNSPNIQERVKTPMSMSKHTDFIKSSCESIIQMNEITVKLNEIVSQNSHNSQNDEENDREIKMILSKQSLNWDMLSPMSLTPEVHSENDQSLSESDERIEKSHKQSSLTSKHREIHKESEILLQSLHISGDEHSEDEIDREDYDFGNLVTENPQNVDTSEDIFNLKKNSAVENNKNQNTTSLFKDPVSESPTEIPNKSHIKLNKNHGPSTKYKKLTNLQKIYKANIPKSKIKTQILPSIKKQHIRPKAYPISAIKYDLASHTNNNPKEIKLAELNAKKLLFKNRDAVVEECKESLKCNFKKPQPLPEYGSKRNAIDLQSCGVAQTLTYSQPKPGLPNTQTNPESGRKQKASLSTATQSNNSSSPHTQTNLLPESCLKKRLSMSTETQSNKISGFPHTQTYPQLESGRMIICMPAETQSSSISEHPQTQTKTLPESSSQKTKSCFSTEARSDLISGCPNTQTNPLPEFGRKRRLNISMGTHYNTKYELSNTQTNLQPECDLSLSISKESISESDLNYSSSKPSRKRIARVGRNQPDLPSEQNNNFITNDMISSTSDTINHNKDADESPPSKKIRAANDLVTSDALHNGKTRLPSISPQENKAKEANIDNNKIKTIEILQDSVNNNKNGLRDNRQSSLNIDEASTPKKLNANINLISPTKSASSDPTRHYADYNDINMFAATNDNHNKQHKDEESDEWKRNVLDSMIFKYGSNPKLMKKPIYNAVIATIIEIGVAKCVKSSKNPEMYRKDLQELANVLKKTNSKKIIGGLMKFINDPARKADFIPKEETKTQKGNHLKSTATQSVITLIDVFDLLEQSGIVLWKLVLDSCEYILFTLEKGATPVFDVIESVTNLYVNICKYRGNSSKIWMFMLNAMYCLSFKAITLIKICLDVVPNILPYANAYRDPGLEPIIRCFVFLLHYYNCDDRFKKVEELRIRLRNKYYYNLQGENETTILFMLRTAIIHLTENAVQRRLLELCLLIVAKRRGTKWCHKNIVQKILLPMIKGEIEVSPSGKRFCLRIIGHILKPYKNEMTIHSEEVVNLLITMFEKPQPQEIKEDIIRGLINMNMKTISDPINKCLFNWNPPCVSPEFEEALAVYIQSKPLKTWQIVHQNYTEI